MFYLDISASVFVFVLKLWGIFIFKVMSLMSSSEVPFKLSAVILMTLLLATIDD